MRIIQFSEDYLPSLGGIASHVSELSRHMVDAGHTVCVLTNVESSNLSDPYYVRRITKFSRSGRFSKLLSIIFILPQIAKIAPDVFHWHTYSSVGPLLARCLGRNVKKVLTNHSSGFLQAVEKKRTLHLKTCLSPADLIIGPSAELANKSSQYTKKPCFYIPNGVDINKFKPVHSVSKKRLIRHQLGLPEEKNIFICPRRLVKKNGVFTLIQSLSLLKISNVLALLVGDGPDAIQAKQLVSHLKVGHLVRFCGPIPNSKMIHYYHASDFAVIPSLMEATSIAGLEAMACGLPIVCTNVGGLPDLVTHEINGLVCEPEDPSDLEEKLTNMMREEEIRLFYGRNGREKAMQQFSWQEIVRRTAHLYQIA